MLLDREINILNYLSDFLKEFREFERLAEAENPELLLVWKTFENARDDQFVKDSTENGVKSWERILKINPKGSDTLEDRKFRILTRLNEKLPYTYTKLEQLLASLCGETGYSLKLLNKEYTLLVRVALAAKSNFEEVKKLLQKMVPANLIIDLSLLYNTHLILKGYTNAILANYTHNYLRNEVLK
ncbi:MAG: putative phage tail protein [Ruminiclostridium sp.]